MRTKEKSLYNYIYLDLRRKIATGHYPVGGLLPAENSLLKEFSTTRTTVRRALSLLRNDDLAVSVPGCGWKVRGISPLAKHEKIGNLLFFSPATDLGSYIFSGIMDKYGADFENLLFCPIPNYSRITEDDFSIQADAYIRKNRPDGIMIFSDRSLGRKNFEFLSRIQIPSVILGLSERCDFDTVASENEYASDLLVNRLINDFNHENIAYFTYEGLKGIPSFEDREKAYISAMKDKSLFPAVYTAPKGFDVMPDFPGIFQSWLSDMGKKKAVPTAFIVSCDIFAYRLASYLENMGFRIPEDISICTFACYGVGHEHRMELPMAISYMNEPWPEIANIAMEILLKRIYGYSGNKTLTLVAPSEIIGETIAERMPLGKESVARIKYKRS